MAVEPTGSTSDASESEKLQSKLAAHSDGAEHGVEIPKILATTKAT
tara:strand:+ start:1011 stop:1148 length:138 start_codon:yes stop_codon:yes gene_type:complete